MSFKAINKMLQISKLVSKLVAIRVCLNSDPVYYDRVSEASQTTHAKRDFKVVKRTVILGLGTSSIKLV